MENALLSQETRIAGAAVLEYADQLLQISSDMPQLQNESAERATCFETRLVVAP